MDKQHDYYFYIRQDGSFEPVDERPEYPFLSFEDFYFLVEDAEFPTRETIYGTLQDLGRAHDRTASWAALKKKDGKVKTVRVWRNQIEPLPGEEFKNVDTCVWVSNRGRIVKKLKGKTKGCNDIYQFMATRRTQAGYLQFPVQLPLLPTHQMGALVLTLFLGPKPDTKSVCLFIDHDPSNISIDNLKWGTRKEDSSRNGRKKHARNIRVKVVRGCRTKLLDPHIGREFDSIQSCAEALGTSSMNIRQYIQNGKVVAL